MACAYLSGGIYGLILDPYLHNIKLLRTFIVNGPHSVFHIVIGSLAVLAIARNRDFTYARLMTFVFAVLSVMGYLQQPVLGLLYLGGADIFLHGFTAILGDVVARMEEKETTEKEIEVLEEEVAEITAEVEA